MSKHRDQQRAESGLVFRNGHLVPAINTPGTKQYKENQAKVNEAIRLQKSLKEKGIVIVSSRKLVV